MEQKLDYQKIDTYFSNIKRIGSDKFPVYIVSDQYGNQSGSITFLGSNELRIEIDNFPRDKTYFSSNLPLQTVDQLLADVSRAGLELKAMETSG